jgi:uncharacterized protein (TIGR02611 family)
MWVRNVKQRAARVFHHLKQHWHTFRHGKIGRRFQERYHRHRQGKAIQLHKALISITLGLIVVSIGVVMLVTPGPGWIMIFVGASLLAGESLTMARLLDRMEIKVRRLCHKVRNPGRVPPRH